MILVNHRLDIPTAVRLREQVTGARTVVTCPHLADRCESEGLATELLKLPGSDVIASAYHAARADAQALQRRVDSDLAVFDADAPGCDWLQLDLFYLFYTLKGWATLWSRVIEQAGDAVWHVPMPDQPFRYGCHSFLPALTLLERLGAAGRPLRAYAYALPAWSHGAVPDLRGQADGPGPDLISHLPTCFYDHRHFEQAMLASGRHCLNLPSATYNVDLPALPNVPLVALTSLAASLTASQLDRIDTVCHALTITLDQALAPLLASERYRQPQVAALVDGLRRQMVFSAALTRDLGARPPRTLLLSNHDAGLHGPLLTFARRHRVQVLMVPHSKIFNAPVAAQGLDLQCLPHPVQGLPVHDAAGRAVPAPALAFPEQLRWRCEAPKPLQTLGVLLTGVSYSGLCGTDLDRFVRGLREIIDACQRQGVGCRIRCKPSEPMVGMLVRELGLPQQQLLADMGGSLDDFATACDLCITYDQLTSGAIDLLRLGVPTLHALVRPLLQEEACMMDAAIVPRLLVPELQQRLALFAADGRQLWSFGRDQFQAYARAWASARPLAAFL